MLLTHLFLHFSLAYSACTAAARRPPGAARKQALSGVSMANGGVPSSSGSEGGNNGTSNVSSGPSSAKSGLVALWEPCNFPSQGIDGPLPCADGAQCICKDESYAQCRTQLDGSWTPPGVSWQCQKPGDNPSGIIGVGETGGTSAGGPSTGGGSTEGGNTDGGSLGGGDSSSAAITSSAPVEASSPVAVSSPAAASSPVAASGPVAGSTGEGTTGGSSTEGGSKSAADRVGGGQLNANQLGSAGGGSTGGGMKASFTQYGGCKAASVACGWYSNPGFNAAVSQSIFGTGPGGGAGDACGKCYQLNPEGGSAKSIVVKVNNLCPSDGNPLCAYAAHENVNFDLCIDDGAAAALFNGGPQQVNGTYESVDCSQWSGGGNLT